MDDELLKKYDFDVLNVKRVRGAFLLETNKGLKLYKNISMSQNRVLFEDRIKRHIQSGGYKNIDSYVYNVDGEIITQNEDEEKFVVKDWFNGNECNLKNQKEIILASNNLAKIHLCMRNMQLTEKEMSIDSDLEDVFEKHNRELKRVKTYIKDKRKKNEFEISYLNAYPTFYEQGEEAKSLLKQSGYKNIFRKAVADGCICHGNYTYHNVLLLDEDIATTNFEKAYIGIQIMDLYQFIRKVMEKNDWNLTYGSLIIEEYDKYKTITKDELKLLYMLLLYPEKFWKVTNFYYNSRKTWLPQRNVAKLLCIQEQTQHKNIFLNWIDKISR